MNRAVIFWFTKVHKGLIRCSFLYRQKVAQIQCIRQPLTLKKMSEERKQSIFQLPARIRGQHSKSFQDSRIKTNHYQVTLSNINKIVIFRVHFQPKIPHDNSKLRNTLFQKCRSQIANNIKNPVYSGMNIYSTQYEESDPIQSEYDCDNYKINVKRVKIFDLQSNPKLLLTFLNNGLRNIMRNLNFVEIGKSGKYFNAKERTNIDNLMMYNGYKSNFVHLQRGYYLRVDAAKKIVRNDTVLDFINQIYAKHTDKGKQEKRAILRGQLVDKTVMANYGKTRYHKIIDLKFQEIQSITFERDNTPMVQYYKDKYQITIKNLKQPLLVAEGIKKEETLLLIPQLMLMTGIPDDFDEMRRKKISESTIKGPRDKLQQIGGLMKKLKVTKQIQALGKIGLKLNENMAEIKGKTMPCPTLELGKNNSIEKGKQACFNLFNKPIFSSKHDIILGIIYAKGTDIKSLLNTFESTSKNLGVRLEINTKFQISNSRMTVKDIQQQLSKASQHKCNICCIIIPGNLKNSYKNIKISAMIGQEMITQVLTDAKLKNKNAQSIATKVLLQIIAKRGNTLWISKPTCQAEQTMLVGFDTSKVGSKTLLAISAFINSTFSSIYSKTVLYEGGQNRYIKMIELLLSAVNSYVERNSKKPKEIIVFQNSCAGDQAKLYYQFFVIPFNDQVEKIYEQSISWSLVMVNVKTNQRFFLGENNVNAGTLVAKDVVSNNYDFYIVSQRSNRGTSVPNHYKVIWSSSKMEEGILQELAFSQCFNYVNWTGSIKVPSILQYAKKCAKFGSQVMETQQVPESLQNRMYFV